MQNFLTVPPWKMYCLEKFLKSSMTKLRNPTLFNNEQECIMQISAILNIAVPLGFPNQYTLPVDVEYFSNIHCNKQTKRNYSPLAIRKEH
jgi:hypothetical protein